MATEDFVSLEQVRDALRAKTVERLPSKWQEGRTCPECGASATRPKCMLEMGGACPRHDPDAYDESPFVREPDPQAQKMADAIDVAIEQQKTLAEAAADVALVLRAPPLLFDSDRRKLADKLETASRPIAQPHQIAEIPK